MNISSYRPALVQSSSYAPSPVKLPVNHQFGFPPNPVDDKGEAAAETGLRLRPAEQIAGRKVGQQPAAAGGRREGSAAYRPQHGGQELQQEEYLQPPQVKSAAWLNGLPPTSTKHLSVERSVSIWSPFLYLSHIMSLLNIEKLFVHNNSCLFFCFIINIPRWVPHPS